MSLFSHLTAPARLALRTGRQVVDVALGAGQEVLHRVRPGDGPQERPRTTRPDAGAASTATTPPAARPASPASPPAPAPAVPVAPPAGTVEPDRTEQPEFEPPHADIPEAEVVYSSADEGAEDGAGASLHVAEPWDGYRGMTAPDVVDRLAVADAATLAAVQLFEGTNRRRKTVLAAVDERLARVG